jgi:pimeloyl-ACP methyl ester carboxylesterase
VEVALVAQAVVHFRESDESSTSARDPSPRGVVALAERIGRAHLGDRRWGALVAVVVAAAAGLIAGWWTPRGPVNATQALAAMAMGLTVGVIAGITMRSRWAMLLAPAVFMGIFEAVRIEATGPTVDAIDLGSFAGSAAFTVGRFFHGLLAVLPMLVGVAFARAWVLRRSPGWSAPTSLWRRAALGARRACAVGVSLGLVVLAVGILRPASTDAIVGPDGKPLPGSVAELARVEMGGHDQTMLIRGYSVDNPVLLFLAGGPGGFEIGTMSRYGGLLERDFVVVTWEQRGTGKSYGSFDPASTLTVDQVVADTIEVTEYLQARFGAEKIYLVGNSYGTIIGVRAVQQRPELYAAFVAAGQMVNVRETDRMFYDDTLAYAQRTGDTALVDTFLANGEPPYDDLLDYLPLVEGEHDWNDYSGVAGHQGRREPTENLAVPEYSLIDQVRSVAGLLDTYSVLYPQLQELDFRADARRLDVPVYLVQGRYEARGRAELAADWFAQLQAPTKQLITFELSGHRPFVEEPERFHDVMTRTVLAQTWPAPLPAPVVAADETAEPADELLDLFARYNPAIWPGHVIAYALGLLVLALLLRRPGTATDRVTAGVLAAMWLWLGVVFQGRYAAQLDPALSAVYGAMFIVQAALFVRAGVLRRQLAFTRGHGVAGRVGWLALGYALVAYPLIGIALGHGYPEAPLFGVAPCPTAIATFGLLLLARPPLPRHLLTIPFVWAILAPLAAVDRGVFEDIGLFVVGVLAVAIVLIRDRRAGPLNGPANEAPVAAALRSTGALHAAGTRP